MSPPFDQPGISNRLVAVPLVRIRGVSGDKKKQEKMQEYKWELAMDIYQVQSRVMEIIYSIFLVDIGYSVNFVKVRKNVQ